MIARSVLNVPRKSVRTCLIVSLRGAAADPARCLGSMRRLTVPSEAQVAEPRMVVGAAAERPAILALALLDRHIVDARDAQAHEALLVELPVLVAIAAEPVTAVVVPLVSEAHRDAVVAKGPELLDQPVVELAVPLPPEERLDRLASLQELRAIAPAAVGRVGEGDARGIARV